MKNKNEEIYERKRLLKELEIYHPEFIRRRLVDLGYDYIALQEECNKLLDKLEEHHTKWRRRDSYHMICERCKRKFCTTLNETKSFRYCPNCGARIDERDT